MRWYITTENGQFVIRGGKGNKRLPLKDYSAMRHDEAALKAFVLRLNAPRDLREKVDYKHAFINDALLSEYKDFLKSSIPTESSAVTEYAYLKNYALDYFIVELGLINPNDWLSVHDTKWASFLLKHKKVRAAKSKRDVVNALNRFVKWLHRKRPNEVPIIEFVPISRAKYSELEARRGMADEIRKPRLVLESDLMRILNAAPDVVRDLILLIASYGLRRNEALGLQPCDVKKGYLSVERQLVKLGLVAPPKGRATRKTPHWFTSPKKSHGWIQTVNATPMHPRTFAAAWTALMIKLDLPYKIHDLRHTFITKAVRIQAPRDVQLAVGHKDLRITMGYLRDDRDLSDEEFEPDEAA